MGNAKEAFQAINKLLAATPRDYDLLLARGFMHKETGNTDLALKDFDDAIKVDPKGFQALHHRSEVFFNLGQHDKSLKDIERVMQLRPHDPSAYAHRAQVRRLNNLKDALEDANKAVELSADSSEMIFLRGDVHRTSGMYAEAIADLERAVEMQPESHRNVFYLALACYQKKESDRAIELFKRALELNPKDHISHYQIGHAHKQQGQYDEAIACYERVLEMHAGFFYANVSIGECLARKKEFAKARAQLQIAERAIGAWEKAQPDKWQPVYSRACLMCVSSLTHGDSRRAEASANADLEKAVQLLEQAAKLGMWDYSHLESDEDLVSLRDHKRYRKLLKGLKR